MGPKLSPSCWVQVHVEPPEGHVLGFRGFYADKITEFGILPSSLECLASSIECSPDRVQECLHGGPYQGMAMAMEVALFDQSGGAVGQWDPWPHLESMGVARSPPREVVVLYIPALAPGLMGGGEEESEVDEGVYLTNEFYDDHSGLLWSTSPYERRRILDRPARLVRAHSMRVTFLMQHRDRGPIFCSVDEIYTEP